MKGARAVSGQHRLLGPLALPPLACLFCLHTHSLSLADFYSPIRIIHSDVRRSPHWLQIPPMATWRHIVVYGNYCIRLTRFPCRLVSSRLTFSAAAAAEEEEELLIDRSMSLLLALSPIELNFS